MLSSNTKCWAALALTLGLASTPAAMAAQQDPSPREEPALPQEPGQDPLPPPPQAQAEGGFEPFPVRGHLSARFRLRWTEDDTDQDLYEYLSLDAGDAEKGQVTAHLFVRATEDLDGNRDNQGFYVFDSITDTYDSSFNSRFYSGYLEFHRMGPVSRVRAGRQYTYDTPVILHFDGGLAESEACPSFGQLRAGVYGGVPVHLFESSVQGDGIIGSFLTASPWRGSRMRGDFIHTRDKQELDTYSDSLYSVEVRQSLAGVFHGHYRHTFLDGHNRDLTAAAFFNEPGLDLMVKASYYRLLRTQEVLSIDFDYFFESLREYAPYDQYQLLVSQGLGKHATLDVGADIRELVGDDDQGQNNREFSRYFVTPTLSDWPLRGASLVVTGERWDVRRTDNGDFWTVGGGLDAKVSDRLTASAGADFSVYKFDPFLNEEREDVWTYYLRIKWKVRDDLRFSIRYEYEDGELDNYQLLAVGATKAF